MKAALQTLGEIHRRGEKIAVLGDMFELGKHSAEEHRQLGKAVANASVDGLYLLGKQAAEVRKGALRAGMRREQIILGLDHASLARQLRQRAKKGDWLLFKGSRGMKMEKVLEALKGGTV
jgi:UDP-N-acetylmuramoyl-tripeptide--D-alanyl-D-alanine ligase